jgi:hypothetical protein
MKGSPPPEPALDRYRERADRFLSALDEEVYLHYSGLKSELDLETIYERFGGLTTLEQARAIGAAVDGGGRMRELWRFACEGYLGSLTRSEDQRVSRLEAALEARLDGERIPFRMLRPEMANSDDRERRHRLEQARSELVASELNPVLLEARERLGEAVHGLGSKSMLDLYLRFGYPLDDLAAQCRAFLDQTERLYERELEGLLRSSLGLGLAEVARWDVPRLMRGNRWDADFPAGRMLAALKATLAGLGIDLREQRNVEIDVEPRPSKSPRAFCAAIEIPDRIVLVIKPIGGPDDWRALFHEAGHTEHFAFTSAELPFEWRRLGDNAVSEGWAFLLEHLIANPDWLERLLAEAEICELAREEAVQTLYFVRRYCAKLLYELELQGDGDASGLPERYVQLLGAATLIEPSASDYLTDVDEGFYCSSYLRAWAFEAQMRSFLRERFGRRWFGRREAGALLRELWSEGQRLSTDELLRQLGGSPPELGALAEELDQALR